MNLIYEPASEPLRGAQGERTREELDAVGVLDPLQDFDLPMQLRLSNQSLLGPVDPSFRALYGRLTFTVRRH